MGSPSNLSADGAAIRVMTATALSPALRVQITEHKAEILHLLDLEASANRLNAAGIQLAIWENGNARIVRSITDVARAINSGAMVFTPTDMLRYVQLQANELFMVRSFVKTFRATVEWTPP